MSRGSPGGGARVETNTFRGEEGGPGYGNCYSELVLSRGCALRFGGGGGSAAACSTLPTPPAHPCVWYCAWGIASAVHRWALARCGLSPPRQSRVGRRVLSRQPADPRPRPQCYYTSFYFTLVSLHDRRAEQQHGQESLRFWRHIARLAKSKRMQDSHFGDWCYA